MLRLILLIVLILAVLGAVPMWPYSAGWGMAHPVDWDSC